MIHTKELSGFSKWFEPVDIEERLGGCAILLREMENETDLSEVETCDAQFELLCDRRSVFVHTFMWAPRSAVSTSAYVCWIPYQYYTEACRNRFLDSSCSDLPWFALCCNYCILDRFQAGPRDLRDWWELKSKAVVNGEH
jgi:hypothetical protein